MGERFGFYTMMAILSLFIMTKFGLDETKTGIIYSIFYASIYLLALVGGLLADKTRNYKGIILTGLLLMTLGYLIIAIPTPTPVPPGQFGLLLALTCLGLLVIAFGNGLFKGNLQALVGQMYDDPKYSKMRDSGFQLFYMFINLGAIFAPFLAVGVRNWWVEKNGFLYNADLPALAHQHLTNSITTEGAARLQNLASEMGYTGSDLTAFANEYLNVFTTGFHYAFAVAIFAMLISLVIYLVNKNKFPDPADNKSVAEGGTAVEEMDIKEVKQRLYALFAVFAVVIFFWFSFHQNGLTLTYFAKDYTNLSQIKVNLGFVTLQGAEIFQAINPFLWSFLTPIIVGFFGWLRAKGKEPSTPRKNCHRYGNCCIGLCYHGNRLYGTSPERTSRCNGRPARCSACYALVTDSYLLHPHGGRALYQSPWHLFCIESGSAQISGNHAGSLAGRYRSWKQPAPYRRHLLFLILNDHYMDGLCGSLPHLHVHHDGYAQMA